MSSFVKSAGNQGAVSISYDIYELYEKMGSELERDCLFGLISSFVYLSVAQEREWKYRLLHKATFLLYSTPHAVENLRSSRWPINQELLDTLYFNTESVIKTPISLPPFIPPQKHSSLAPTFTFKSILFYNFYLEDPCECASRSWCHSFWLRKFLEEEGQEMVDILLVGRDESKTVYRMDFRGCFKNLGFGLADAGILLDQFDVVFVFEINGFMNPENRVLKKKLEVIYPTFDLSEGQIRNFQYLNVTVIKDDEIVKPPNSRFTSLLSIAFSSSLSRDKRNKNLIYPAEVRPGKGQVEFLKIFDPRTSEVDKIIFVGSCGAGNFTYCSEFNSLVSQAGNFVEWIEDVSDEELAKLYSNSVGVVLMPLIDCNPRAIYEGLWANLPFVVNENARVSSKIQHLGRIVKSGNDIDINESLYLFMRDIKYGRKWNRNEHREFAEKYVSEDAEYLRIFNLIETNFRRVATIDISS